MKTTVISLVLILLVYSLAYPQKLEWLSYTSGNYVSGIYVSALKEEGNFIWAGTTNGLVKIDKSSGVSAFYSTINSGLPSNVITSIAIDSSGNKIRIDLSQRKGKE